MNFKFLLIKIIAIFAKTYKLYIKLLYLKCTQVPTNLDGFSKLFTQTMLLFLFIQKENNLSKYTSIAHIVYN